jgi:hypothetical protein
LEVLEEVAQSVEHEAPSDDRRDAHRSRVLLGGKLLYGDMAYSLDCTIRDLSDSGARVRVAGDPHIGGPVWLINNRAGTAHRGSVLWRSSNELGLQFAEEIDLKQPITGALHHLRRLWLECARR